MTDQFNTLIQALQQPAVYPHPVDAVQVLETHISWVLLTGPFAYKIKKPVDLGFVDFSTLEKREHFCREELRLNRRLAPQLYLDVTPIAGTPANPAVGGTGEAIEFAVKMRQFPQHALLSRLLHENKLSPAHIDALAREVAAFHRQATVAAPEAPFGSPEQVRQPVDANFTHLIPACGERRRPQIDALRAWSEREFTSRYDDFLSRKAQGFIRECHGDMHLGNMILEEPAAVASSTGPVTIFDCIEFNESLRWIDVLSETAFLTMDLEDRGRPDFAHRGLNAYLEITGDYAGLAVLPYYLVYRALVRAKVAAIRLTQQRPDAPDSAGIRDEFHGYLDLAETYTQPGRPSLVIAHGLSGSGKTTGTQTWIERRGAVRIRSDIERKRLFGLDPSAHAAPRSAADLYSPEASERTYDRLAQLAAAVVQSGRGAVIDATFLKRRQRDKFRQLAARLNVPFGILNFEAADDELAARIVHRQQAGRDASEADLEVLAHQRATHEPLGEDERADVIA